MYCSVLKKTGINTGCFMEFVYLFLQNMVSHKEVNKYIGKFAY
jgi:hypothetical protein